MPDNWNEFRLSGIFVVFEWQLENYTKSGYLMSVRRFIWHYFHKKLVPISKMIIHAVVYSQHLRA
jgi:hypothetical protein